MLSTSRSPNSAGRGEGARDASKLTRFVWSDGMTPKLGFIMGSKYDNNAIEVEQCI
jgi:hypothetical protein